MEGGQLDLEGEVIAIVRDFGKLHRTTRRHIPEYSNLQQRTMAGDSKVLVPLTYLLTSLLTYLLHGAESFLRS